MIGGHRQRRSKVEAQRQVINWFTYRVIQSQTFEGENDVIFILYYLHQMFPLASF